jgi:hypothetical protein
MIVKTPPFQRPVDNSTFTDITPLAFTIGKDALGGPALDFAGDLTDDQVQQIRERVDEPVNSTTLKQQTHDAFVGLRQTRDSTGALTNAQLSNAVRLQAKVIIALGRMVLGEEDAVD